MTSASPSIMLELLITHPTLAVALAGVLGLFVGSFLNVVMLRLPPRMEHEWKEQSREMLGLDPDPTPKPPGIALSRSRCPKCGHQLGALENIPVVSFVFLRGKCANCGTPISWQYPVVELLTAVLSAIVVWRYGLNLQAAAALLMTWLLIAMSGIDVRTQLLPDDLTLSLLWLGLLVSLVPLFVTPQQAIIGAACGYGVLWLVFHVFKLITGKEGMGFGDFKLLAALGAWLGAGQLPLVILLSSLVGALVGGIWLLRKRDGKSEPIPFGPFLAAAGFIALIWGPQIVSGYLQYAKLQ
jgi:leader peptidase (prepilin peptidase) / N-methyltransferase